MKKYALLRLKFNANFVIAEKFGHSKKDAIKFFQENFPLLKLDDDCYSKIGDESWCIAEYFH